MKYAKCARCALNYVASEGDLCPICRRGETYVDELCCTACGLCDADGDDGLCSACRREIGEREEGEATAREFSEIWAERSE